MHLAAHSLFTECVLHAQLRPQSYIHIYISKIICQLDRQVPRQARHHTLAESYSEGATLSQFIILTKKGKTLVKTIDRKGFFIIIFLNLIIF